MQKDKYVSMVTWGGRGKHSSKPFSINSKNKVFNPHFLKGTLSNEKRNFADNSRVEPTISLMEKLFSLKHFSGHFYGQSFIKTVRGPFTLKIFLGLICLSELKYILYFQ